MTSSRDSAPSQLPAGLHARDEELNFDFTEALAQDISALNWWIRLQAIEPELAVRWEKIVAWERIGELGAELRSQLKEASDLVAVVHAKAFEFIALSERMAELEDGKYVKNEMHRAVMKIYAAKIEAMMAESEKLPVVSTGMLKAKVHAKGEELIAALDTVAELEADMHAKNEKLHAASKRIKELNAELVIVELESITELNAGKSALERIAELKAEMYAKDEELHVASNSITELKVAHQRRIEELKAAHQRCIKELKAAHQRCIEELKAEIRAWKVQITIFISRDSKLSGRINEANRTYQVLQERKVQERKDALVRFQYFLVLLIGMYFVWISYLV